MTARVLEMSPVLSSPGASKEDIEKALQENIPSTPIDNKPTVLLPMDRRKALAEQLHQTKNLHQRAAIIRNSLEYTPASLPKDFKMNPLQEYK